MESEPTTEGAIVHRVWPDGSESWFQRAGTMWRPLVRAPQKASWPWVEILADGEPRVTALVESERTDREGLLALLDRFGITPCLAGDKPEYEVLEGNDVYLFALRGGVQGYFGFNCRFEFDDEGRFQEVGVWE